MSLGFLKQGSNKNKCIWCSRFHLPYTTRGTIGLVQLRGFLKEGQLDIAQCCHSREWFTAYGTNQNMASNTRRLTTANHAYKFQLINRYKCYM